MLAVASGMPNHLTSTFTVSALVALAGAAHADDQAATTSAAEDLGQYAAHLARTRAHAGEQWAVSAPAAKDCDAVIKRARGAGLADDTKLFNWGFGELDEAHFANHDAYILLGEAPKLCADYAAWLKVIMPAHLVEAAASTIETIGSIEPEAWGPYVADQWAEQARECTKGVTDALAAGVPADRKTMIVDAQLTLGEGEQRYCQGLLAESKSMGEKIAAAHAADLAKRSEPWKQAGFTGDRLDLMVEHDLIDWMGKGCQRITDMKALKRASVLFQWWETDDGVITIRRFQFKGDKLARTTEKTYTLRENAYRGCK